MPLADSTWYRMLRASAHRRNAYFLQNTRFTYEQFKQAVELLQEALPLEFFRIRSGNRSGFDFFDSVGLLLMWLSSARPIRALAISFGVSFGTAHSELQTLLTGISLIQHKFISMPWEPRDCISTASSFSRRRPGVVHLNNVVGAIDGSFIFLRVRKREKRPYVNRKWPLSAVNMLLIADGDMRVRFVSASTPGNKPDHQSFRRVDYTTKYFKIRDRLEQGQIPESEIDRVRRVLAKFEQRRAEGRILIIPKDYSLIGDSGFQFVPHLLRVSTEKDLLTFQKHLALHRVNTPAQRRWEEDFAKLDSVISGSRSVVERVFAELKGTWKILVTRILAPVPKAEVVYACCVMHNIRIQLRNRDDPGSDQEPGDPGVGFSARVPNSKAHVAVRKCLIQRLREARVKRGREGETDESPAQRVKTLSPG